MSPSGEKYGNQFGAKLSLMEFSESVAAISFMAKTLELGRKALEEM